MIATVGLLNRYLPKGIPVRLARHTILASIAIALLFVANGRGPAEAAVAGVVMLVGPNSNDFITTPDGVLTVRVGDADLTGTQTLDVTVTSSSDPAGFTLTLKETGAGAGVLTATFDTTTSTASVNLTNFT